MHGSIKRILLVAAGLAAAVAAPAWAAQPGVAGDGADEGSVLPGMNTDRADTEPAALAEWRVLMAQNPTPSEGCFHASYPNIVWEGVDCKVGQPRVHPVHIKPADDEPEVTGNGHDYVAEATGLITFASGGFAIKGVKSEKGVGVAAFGGGGILGPNEYSIQINSNDGETTHVCAGHSDCKVWQQFVYATDYFAPGEAGVFMQYWLLDWGSAACPSGFSRYESDCYKNSAVAPAPDVPVKDLGKLGLAGSAVAGGDDMVSLSYGSDAYSVTAKDRVLDISSVWKKAEFNVFGDAGGSRADFNSGSSITVTLLLLDGSPSAPKCLANDGTTGETNNLNLGKCVASGGLPNIQFKESN